MVQLRRYIYFPRFSGAAIDTGGWMSHLTCEVSSYINPDRTRMRFIIFLHMFTEMQEDYESCSVIILEAVISI
jgi:hypothetical protein